MGANVKRIVIAALAVAAWGAGLSAPARAQEMITAQNPETVRALFEAWGYRPTALRDAADEPHFNASHEDFTFIVSFAGCTAGRDCRRLVFVVNYRDITNPPLEWVNSQNYRFDLISAARREDNGYLSLVTGVTLGPQGIPVSTFRLAVDGWIEDTGAIERNAGEAGLINNPDPEDPAPAT